MDYQMTYEEITRAYHLVETTIFEGRRFEMREDEDWGDEAQAIVTDGNIYVYTWESMDYTLTHLQDEYEVYRLAY